MTDIQVGVVFPQGELRAADGGSLRRWVQGVEALGFAHVLAYDHVAGRPGTYPGTQYHEALVMLSHFAAAATRIGLATGVIVLPQRQTLPAAKQMADLANLADGRLRVGLGTGWNTDEYTALGADWAARGDVLDEQLDLLEQLWTGRPVMADTAHHRIAGLALDPPPSLPPAIWLAGMAPRALRRVARRAAGWLPFALESVETDLPRIAPLLAELRRQAAEEGRDPNALGLEVQVRVNDLPGSRWATQVPRWQEAGATHLSIVTRGAGSAIDNHLSLLDRVRGAFLA